MRKLLWLGLALIFLLSCKSNVQEGPEESRYYPSEEYFDNPKLKKIALDSDIFGIVRSVNSTYENDSVPYIEFSKKNITNSIIPFRNDYGNYDHRNYINVTQDSVFSFYHRYPNNLLMEVLKMHYENNGRRPFMAESAEEAIVEIVLDQNAKGEDLKNSISLVISTFDSLNLKFRGKLQLKIALEITGREAPPPFLLEN